MQSEYLAKVELAVKTYPGLAPAALARAAGLGYGVNLALSSLVRSGRICRQGKDKDVKYFMNDPKRVRLTKDFQDTKVEDVHYPAGTILVRNSGGQYVPEGGKLGVPCVTMFSLIRDI